MASPAFDDQAFDSTNAFSTDAFDFTTAGPEPDVATGFGRRRMASYIKRGGVGTLKGRTT